MRHATVRTRWQVLLAGLASVALLTGCLPTAERSIGVDPAHATSVELYFYAFDEQPTPVDRVIITEPGLVAEILHGFTDMPVRGSDRSNADLAGDQAAGVRFVLDDGTTAELTQVFVEHGDVVIIWSDGDRSSTEWGVPLVDYYSDLGEFTADVDPSLAPSVFADD